MTIQYLDLTKLSNCNSMTKEEAKLRFILKVLLTSENVKKYQVTDLVSSLDIQDEEFNQLCEFYKSTVAEYDAISKAMSELSSETDSAKKFAIIKEQAEKISELASRLLAMYSHALDELDEEEAPCIYEVWADKQTLLEEDVENISDILTTVEDNEESIKKHKDQMGITLDNIKSALNEISRLIRSNEDVDKYNEIEDLLSSGYIMEMIEQDYLQNPKGKYERSKDVSLDKNNNKSLLSFGIDEVTDSIKEEYNNLFDEDFPDMPIRFRLSNSLVYEPKPNDPRRRFVIQDTKCLGFGAAGKVYKALGEIIVPEDDSNLFIEMHETTKLKLKVSITNLEKADGITEKEKKLMEINQRESTFTNASINDSEDLARRGVVNQSFVVIEHPDFIQPCEIVVDELADKNSIKVRYVSQFFEGEELFLLLNNDHFKKIPTLDLLEGLLDLANTLKQRFHYNKLDNNECIINHDIKSENVIYNMSTGKFVFVDGAYAQMKGEGHERGTPGLLPPECYKESYQADPRTDVYGFGALVMEIFFDGKMPHFVYNEIYRSSYKGVKSEKRPYFAKADSYAEVTYKENPSTENDYLLNFIYKACCNKEERLADANALVVALQQLISDIENVHTKIEREVASLSSSSCGSVSSDVAPSREHTPSPDKKFMLFAAKQQLAGAQEQLPGRRLSA